MIILEKVKYMYRVGNSSVCLTGQVVQTCGELIGHFTKLTGHFIIQISTTYNTKKKRNTFYTVN